MNVLQSRTLPSRTTLYWLCQVSGWSLYTLFVWLIFSLADGKSCDRWWVYTTATTSMLGLPMTHVFRAITHRWQWLRLPPFKLVVYVIIATSLMAFALSFLSEQLATYVFHTTMFNDSADKLDFVLNWFTRMFLWSALYFGIHFVERLRATEIEKWKLEASLKESELMALKSQMNPHFIFNALNTIRELTLEDPHKAMQAMTQLASILRYSLRSADTQTVPLRDEWKIVQDYLALESLRFEQRLRVVLDVDEQTLDIPVPPLVVQTLVENAVKHGIANLPKGGTITIQSRRTPEHLSIAIINTGQLAAHNATEGQRLGIANTRERLSLLFGEKASLTLLNKDSTSVEAHIIIPIAPVFSHSSFAQAA